MNKNSKVYVAGHTGLVGSNLIKALYSRGYNNIIYYTHRGLGGLDLLNQKEVTNMFDTQRPEYVFLCAARVGGIKANDDLCADFIYENTRIQINIIKACHDYKVNKLLFLGSSCIYPKSVDTPIKESSLLESVLEETNIGYAIAKINGIKMCQLFNKQYGDVFISIMPTNLYGRGDTYDLQKGHVFSTLIMNIHKAKVTNAPCIELWGSGKPLREFLFVEDFADALIFLMNDYSSPEIINVGTGKDIPVYDLTKLMCVIIGYEGKIVFDSSKPDGTYRKVMDVSKINSLGWEASTSLRDGIIKTYQYYQETL